MSDSLKNQKYTIGVYAPHFQGTFIGELANQIRQNCLFRNLKYIGYSTGDFGSFNCDIGIDELDAAIIIRNCVSNDFAKKLIEKKIATASIAYDYFPLDIPAISSDNAKGAELALNYLFQRGHQAISFIGDLRHYDLRKRYEHYVELMTENGLEASEDLLINVSNTEISGGVEAGNEFIARGCNASAIFCAAGFTTLGLVKRLQQNKIEVSDKLEVVGYDAMPLNSILCSNISAVDQNIHIIAYKAISIVIDMLEDKGVDKRICLVEPKLIKNEDVTDNQNSPYLATSVDLPEIHNASYMASVLNNHFAWTEEIYDSKFDQIMSISPVFEKFMALASLSKFSTSGYEKNKIKVIKIFRFEKTTRVNVGDAESICPINEFPPAAIEREITDGCDNSTHFFVRPFGRISAVLSIYGNYNSNAEFSSYLYLCGLIDTIVKLTNLQVENKQLSKNIGNIKPIVKEDIQEDIIKFPVEWDIQNGNTTWSEGALAILGLTSPMDINIYQYMDLTDRVKDDKIDDLRNKIAECATSGKNFSTVCKLKSKEGNYLEVFVESQAIIGKDDQVSFIKFQLGFIEGES